MHHFHVDNDGGHLGIGYDIIIGHDLILHLDLTADFKRQVLQWDGYAVLMKDPSGLLGQQDLTNLEIRDVVM